MISTTTKKKWNFILFIFPFFIISFVQKNHTHCFLIILFSVNMITGDIKLQSVATSNTKYVYTLRATDGGNPALTSVTSATLRVDTYVPNLHVLTFRLTISR